jgi:hypothetical protein
MSKKILINRSLIGSVMIDDELDREDHSSIPYNCDWERAEFDVRTDPQTRLT